MKQTAVEWLMEQLTKNYPLTKESAESIIEQAKAMEREQIMTAFTQGDIFGEDYYDGINITEENYYNQTFKDESNN